MKLNIRKLFPFLVYLAVFIFGSVLYIHLQTISISEIIEKKQLQVNTPAPGIALISVCFALVVGLLEFTLFNRWQKLPFYTFVMLKYITLFTAIAVSSVLIFVVYDLVVAGIPLGSSFSTLPSWILSDTYFAAIVTFFLFSIVLNVLKTLSEYLGPLGFAEALLGKYHLPSEADLTFLFIDLRSSTTIAEQLGNVKYSRLISRCFELLTDSIQEYNASVYQFVGDEAVLTWPTAYAKRHFSAVELFFDFQKRLENEHQLFLSEYGLQPAFRAAVHAGTVTITEIRSVKKQVVYHGDVLSKQLVVSAVIAHDLQKNRTYGTRLLDSVQLRGKLSTTDIFEVFKSKA